ncbi:MAG: FumA C-terminus/TtdB family hydratase beta subunit [Candidatus Altiarchaeota archaeon]
MVDVKEKRLRTPLSSKDVKSLNVGDIVYLSGSVYTARDKAHKRIQSFMRGGKKLPFELEGAVVYHCGPLVRKDGGSWRIVSAGPTTSARMDELAPEIIEAYGIKAVIGKGGMDENVLASLKKTCCVYLAYTGGAGALAASRITGVEDVFWIELSTPEAVWKLRVEDFGPLVVAMDAWGGSLYNRGGR